MPLNKDFILVLLDCYEGVIEKRTKKTSHLIEKDLDNARLLVQNNHQKSVSKLRDIELKAMLKLGKYDSTRKKYWISRIIEHFKIISEQPSIEQFKFFNIINSSELKADLQKHFKKEMTALSKHTNTSEFLKIFDFVLKDSESIGQTELFNTLLIQFIKREKKHPTLDCPQLTSRLLLSLQKNRNYLYTALLVLGEYIFPDQMFLSFLCDFVKAKIDDAEIRKKALNENTINWLKSGEGRLFLEELSPYSYFFDHIEYMFDCEWCEEDGIEVLKEDIKEELDDLNQLSCGFSENFLMGYYSYKDPTPLAQIEKIFGFKLAYLKRPYVKICTSKGKLIEQTLGGEAKMLEKSGDQLDFLDMFGPLGEEADE